MSFNAHTRRYFCEISISKLKIQGQSVNTSKFKTFLQHDMYFSLLRQYGTKRSKGHKILRNLHQLFDLCTASQIIGGGFAKFHGLLRIHEL